MHLLDLPTEILLQIFRHAAGDDDDDNDGPDRPAGRSVASLLGHTGKRENVLTTLALVSRKSQDIAYEFFYGSLSMTNDRARKFYRSLEENDRLGSLVVSYRFINCDLAHLRAFYRSIYTLPAHRSALRAIHSPMVATLSSLLVGHDGQEPTGSIHSAPPIRSLTLSAVHPIRDSPRLLEPGAAWMNTSELERLVLNFTPVHHAPTLPLRASDLFYSARSNPLFPPTLRSLTLGHPVQGLEPDAILPTLDRLPGLTTLVILGPSAPSLGKILRAAPRLDTLALTKAPPVEESDADSTTAHHAALRQIDILSPNESRLVGSFHRRFTDLVPSLRSFGSSPVGRSLPGLPALRTVRLAGLEFDDLRASAPEGADRQVGELADVLHGWGIQLVDRGSNVW